jgi:acetyl esterase/lipase
MTPRLALALARWGQRPVLRWWPHAPSLRVIADQEARLTTLPPPGLHRRRTEVAGPGRAVPCWHLTPQGARDGARLLYLHGGGFVLGSERTHRALAARLAQAAGATAVVPDYRLAPEHPFPAALEDAAAVWDSLAAEGGRLTLAGDSAGGALALALAQRLAAAGRPGPAALALIPPAWGLWAAAAWLGGHDPADPAVSPLFGPMAGLPPVAIHAVAEEMLRDDSTRLAERLRAAGVPVRLRLWHGLPHVFQIRAGRLRQADASLDALGAFLRDPGAAE